MSEPDEMRKVSGENPSTTECLEGYVVDIMCLRKYPQDELFERAREHTVQCALMGHCMESGYALVDEAGRVHLLEPAATPAVAEALRRSSRGSGILLRAVRETDDGEMRTQSVSEIGADRQEQA